MPMTDEQRKRLQELLKHIQSGEAARNNAKSNAALQKVADELREKRKQEEEKSQLPYQTTPAPVQPVYNFAQEQTQQQKKKPEEEQLDITKGKKTDNTLSIINNFAKFTETTTDSEHKNTANRIKELAKTIEVDGDSSTHDTLDVEQARYNPDTKYNVQIISAGNADVALGYNVEVINIVDGKGVKSNAATDATYNIGKDSLIGAQEGAKYLLHNKSTGELFQYAVDEHVGKLYDERDNVQTRIDSTNIKYAQHMGNLKAEQDAINLSMKKKLSAMGWHEGDPYTDAMLSVIQDDIERYESISKKMEAYHGAVSETMQKLSARKEAIDTSVRGTNTIDADTYFTCKRTQLMYRDLQDVYAGKMSKSAFKQTYGQDASVNLMNQMAVSASEADIILSSSDGIVYDRDGYQSDRLNEIAQGYETNEELYNHYLSDTAKEFGNRLNMEDNKQINSLTDIVRGMLVRKIDGIQNHENLIVSDFLNWVGTIKDSVEYLKTSATEITSKEGSNPSLHDWVTNSAADNFSVLSANASTGLSGWFLNELGDAGNFMVGWANSLANSAGFQGRVSAIPKYNMLTEENRSAIYNFGTKSTFKEGRLNNSDYYMRRADMRDDLHGMDRFKQFMKAYFLATEAALRGDLSGNIAWFSDNNFDTTEYNWNGMAKIDKSIDDFKDEHPFGAMVVDTAFNIALDPGTWTTLMALDAKKSFDSASDMAKIYARSTLDAASLPYSETDDAFRSISKIYENAIKTSSKGAVTLDKAAAERVAGALVADSNIKTALQPYKEFNNLNKSALRNNILEVCKEAIKNTSATPEMAEMWASAQTAIASIQDWEALDRSLALIETGAAGAAGKVLGKAASKGIALINTARSGESFKTATFINQLCNNLKKAGGSKGFESISKQIECEAKATVVDLARTAIAEGRELDPKWVDEIIQLDIDSRTDWMIATARSEIKDLKKSLRATVDPDFSSVKFYEALNTREMVDSLNTYGRMGVDRLNGVTMAAHGMTYDEYIAYLRRVADELSKAYDFDGANYFDRLRMAKHNVYAKHSLSKAIDAEVASLEKYIMDYNNRYMRLQVSVIYKAISEHTDEAIRALMDMDISYAAPDLKKAYDDVVQMLLENKNIKIKNDAIRDINKGILRHNRLLSAENDDIRAFNNFVTEWNRQLKLDNQQAAAQLKRMQDWNAAIKDQIEQRRLIIDDYNATVTQFYDDIRARNQAIHQHNQRVADWNAAMWDHVRELTGEHAMYDSEYARRVAEISDENAALRRAHSADVRTHNQHVADWNVAVRADARDQLAIGNLLINDEARARMSEIIADNKRAIEEARNASDAIAAHNKAVSDWNKAVADFEDEFGVHIFMTELSAEDAAAMAVLDAEREAQSKLQKIAEQYEGIVKNLTESRMGPGSYIPAFNPLKHDDVATASPTDFIDSAFAQFGATPTQEDYNLILGDAASRFMDNPETAGLLYTFKESSECNLTSIVNNTALELCNDPEFIAAADAAGLAGRLPDMDTVRASKEFIDILSDHGNNVGIEYHMIMDSYAGSAAKLNTLAMDYMHTDGPRAAVYFNQMVDTIKSNATRYATAGGYDINWDVHEQKIIDALTAALSNVTEDSIGIVAHRNNVYDNLNVLYHAAQQEESLADYIPQISDMLNYAKYSSNNSELGTVMSYDMLMQRIRLITGDDTPSVDLMKALFDTTQGGKLSLGITQTLNSNFITKYMGSDVLTRYKDCDTILKEVNYYCRDLSSIRKTFVSSGFTADEIRAMAHVINIECEGLSDMQSLRYIEYFNDVMTNTDDIELQFAAIIDAIDRLGMDTRYWTEVLDVPDPFEAYRMFSTDFLDYTPGGAALKSFQEDEVLARLSADRTELYEAIQARTNELLSDDFDTYDMNPDQFKKAKTWDDEQLHAIKESQMEVEWDIAEAIDSTADKSEFQEYIKYTHDPEVARKTGALHRRYTKLSDDAEYQRLKSMLTHDKVTFRKDWAQYRKTHGFDEFKRFRDYLKYKRVELPEEWSFSWKGSGTVQKTSQLDRKAKGVVLDTESQIISEYIATQDHLRTLRCIAQDTQDNLTYVNARRAALESFAVEMGVDDIAKETAHFEARAQYYNDLLDVYKAFNNDVSSFGGAGQYAILEEQIGELRRAEKVMWDNNISRVLNLSRDDLDHMLLTSGMNAMVCDTSLDPRIATWVLARESEGYIVSRVQYGGKSFSVVSLDVQHMDPERIKFLREAESSVQGLSSTFDFKGYWSNELSDRYAAAYEFNRKHLGDAWANSAIGSRIQMDFYDDIQSKLPVQCQLDSSYRTTHYNGYMSNMLCSSFDARQMGAVRGNMIGSWYHSAIAAAEHTDNVHELARALNVKPNTLGYQMQAAGIALTDTTTIQDMLHRGHYHLLDLNAIDTVGDAHKYAYREITDMTDYTRAANAILVNDSEYNYILNGVRSANSVYDRVTNPAWWQAICDAAQHARGAYISGMLYFSNFQGTAKNNVIDSNIKALAEMGEYKAAYTKHWLTMGDQRATYVSLMSEIAGETGGTGISNIYKYIEAHPEVDADQLVKWHTAFTMTGTVTNDKAISAANAALNKRLLNSTGLAISADDQKVIEDAFNFIRDNSVRRKSDTDIYEALLSRLRSGLADSNIDDDGVRKIANLYGTWKNGDAQTWYSKFSERFGWVNKWGFDGAEDRVRNAMLLTLMDEGVDPLEANARVIKTQFDYATRTGKGVSLWDKVMPFAKYQFSNLAYWADVNNYSCGTINSMKALSKMTGYGKSTAGAFAQEYAMNYTRNKLNSDDSGLRYNVVELFKQSLNDTITDFKGTPEQYVDGIDVSDHRYLRVGNGMMETYDWFNSVINAPFELAQGKVPSLIQDTFFSPLKTIITHSADICKFFKSGGLYEFEYNKKKDKTFYYDMLNLVPVFGNIANICITDYKHILRNKALFALANAQSDCRNELLNSLGCAAYSLGFSIFNSCVGLKYGTEQKKIFRPYLDADGNRVTWSTLSAEEKAKYKFVPGISRDISYATNPKSMYGLYGRLARLGLDQKDIKALTSKCNYTNEYFYKDNKGQRYIDTQLLETTVLDMLEQGYSVYEISYLLALNDRWYDMNTHEIIIGSASVERAIIDRGFLALYNEIPAYIKYTDQYSRMMEQYKALGMSTQEAWWAMINDHQYINESGLLTTLTAEAAKDYSKYITDAYFEEQKDDGFFEWYAQLPEYIKYEKGAFSRTLAYLKQMFSDSEAKDMIMKGAYYTPDGRLINCSELTRREQFTSSAFQDEAGYWHKAGDFQVDGYWFHKGDNPYLGRGSFQAYWNELPDYLRYTKGAWSQTNKVLKEAGFDYNTRMQAMLDGAYAMQVDPNSEYFKQLLAQQKLKAVTKTVYVTKKVPLRECSNVDGKWVWNGPQSMKITDFGEGYSMQSVEKDMEFNAASLGLTSEKKWKSYDAAEVEVQVPQTVTEMVSDSGQIFGRVVTTQDGKTWVIVPCPPYIRHRRGYIRHGYPAKFWKKYDNYRRKKYERIRRVKGYVKNNKPMRIEYSNVRTYSKQHFMTGQATGYNYWYQWGDANVTNHRNRNNRLTQCPNTYRNPRARQRNLYKEMYVKFGASRMRQRQNIAGYSNMSVTKLRRNELYNRMYNIRINGARG